jgi:hypothetical protein
LRVIGMVLIMVAAAAAAPAQTPVGGESPPDVLILGRKFIVQTVRTFYVAPIPDPHPYVPPLSRGQVEQSGWGPVTKRFLYQVRIRNTGHREIRAVEWAYVLTDPLSQQVVGRHQFRSGGRIRPRQEKTLKAASAGDSVPTQIVSADRLAKGGPEEYAEQVIINCLAYSDGSVWKRPGYRGRCESIKRRGRLP